MLKVLKLTRLFRLGRIVSFLKYRTIVKSSLKMVLIVAFLLLCIHFINCYWYTIVTIQSQWFPPKDVDFKETLLYDAPNHEEYLLIFYYATLVVIGADFLPTTNAELLS